MSLYGLFRRRAANRNRRGDVAHALNFNEADHEDLSDGPTQASSEGQRSLLNHRWVWMGLVVFALGVLGHNPALLAITASMLITVAISALWSRTTLNGVYYQRHFHHLRAFPGESLPTTLTVENRKLLPVTWLQIEDEWPLPFGPADESLLSPGVGETSGFLVNVYTLRGYERVRRHYLLLARTRGIYPLGPAHLISGDPFSLFERGGTTAERRDVLIVYPPLDALATLPLLSSDPFGDKAVPQRLFEDPQRTIGVRDYTSGDGFRSIHWKATARAGSLQVRQYEPTRALSVALCLNIASFEQHWRGTWPAMIEHLIAVAASVADWSLTQGYAVGLLANAPFSQADQPLRVAPGRSRNQLTHILELLAGISYFVTQEYAQFILSESPRLPWGTTLALFTGYVNDPLLMAIEQMRHGGRKVILIAVGTEAPPLIPGVLTYHVPVEEREPDAARPGGAIRDLR